MHTEFQPLSGRMHCVIKVRGQLSASWSDYFDSLHVTTEGQFTMFSGIAEDQSALHGILNTIRDFGLPLTLVECTECSSLATPKNNAMEHASVEPVNANHLRKTSWRDTCPICESQLGNLKIWF